MTEKLIVKYAIMLAIIIYCIEALIIINALWKSKNTERTGRYMRIINIIIFIIFTGITIIEWNNI